MYQTNNLYQNDPAWKNIPLGFSTDGGTIGTWGCLLTSLTMLVNGLGYNETPPTVNDKMKQANGFQGAMIIPSALPAVFPKVIFKRFINSEHSIPPIDQIDAALSAGKPVVVEVDWSAASGIQTHWVLLKDKVGGDYSIYDPYCYPGDAPGKDVFLTQRYKFSGSGLQSSVLAVFFFDSATMPVPPPIKPLPANAVTVYVAEDGLALRAAGAVDGPLLKRLAVGSALTSLETSEATNAKLGQQGQWLNVQDASDVQGYMAAWYLSASPAPVTPPPPPPSTGGSLNLLPLVDGLALRSQPVVSDSTLIKRLPLNTLLAVKEPVDQAAPKIGTQGMWIYVSDPLNAEGFVAGWYVKRADAVPSGGPPNPPSSSVTVKTISDQLALRSQPLILDSTLIKRLPLGSYLTLVNPGEAVKIGVSGQWLNVNDSTGTTGFVAAWYVSR